MPAIASRHDRYFMVGERRLVVALSIFPDALLSFLQFILLLLLLSLGRIPPLLLLHLHRLIVFPLLFCPSRRSLS